MSYPSANIRRNSDKDSRQCDGTQQANSERSTDQRAHLPQHPLFPGPRSLAPESAARRTEERMTSTQKNNYSGAVQSVPAV